MTVNTRISPSLTERKKRLFMFYNFVKENKDKYPFSQILALFGIKTGLQPSTVLSYAQQFLDANIISVNGDRVVKILEISPP